MNSDASRDIHGEETSTNMGGHRRQYNGATPLPETILWFNGSNF